LAGQEE